MSSLNQEELWRSNITGKIYRKIMVTDQMVVLESVNGSTQVLSTGGNLELFYTNVFNPEEAGFNLKGEDRPSKEGRFL